MWACRCYHVLIGLNLVQQATEHSPSLSPTHTHTHKPNTKGRRQGSTENKHAREFKPLYDERRFLSWPVLFFLFSSLTAFSKILIVPLKHYIAGIYLLCHECFYLSSKALMTVSLDISPSIFTKKTWNNVFTLRFTTTQTCFSAQHHLTDTQSSKAPAQLQKQGSRLSSVYKGLNW